MTWCKPNRDWCVGCYVEVYGRDVIGWYAPGNHWKTQSNQELLICI